MRKSHLTIDGPEASLEVLGSLFVRDSSIIDILRGVLQGQPLSGLNYPTHMNVSKLSKITVTDSGRIEDMYINISNKSMSTWIGAFVLKQVDLHNYGLMNWLPYKLQLPQVSGSIRNDGDWILNNTFKGESLSVKNYKAVYINASTTHWEFPGTYEAGRKAEMHIQSNTSILFKYSSVHRPGSSLICDQNRCNIALGTPSSKVITHHHVQAGALLNQQFNNSVISLELLDGSVIQMDQGDHTWNVASFTTSIKSHIEMNPCTFNINIIDTVKIIGSTPINMKGSMSGVLQSTMLPGQSRGANVTLKSPQNIFISGTLEGTFQMQIQTPELIMSEGVSVGLFVELQLINTIIKLDERHPPTNSSGQLHIGNESELSLGLDTYDFGNLKFDFARGSQIHSDIQGLLHGTFKSAVWRFAGKVILRTNSTSPPVVGRPYPILQGDSPSRDVEVMPKIDYTITGAFPTECIESVQEYKDKKWSVLFTGIPAPSTPEQVNVPQNTKKSSNLVLRDERAPNITLKWRGTGPCNSSLSYIIETTLGDKVTNITLSGDTWVVPNDVPICSFFRVRARTVATWIGNSDVKSYSNQSTWHDVAVNPIGFGPKSPSVSNISTNSFIISLGGETRSLDTPCNWSVNAIELRLTSNVNKKQTVILVSPQSDQVEVDTLESCSSYTLDMRYQMVGDHVNGSFFSEYGLPSNLTTRGMISTYPSKPTLSATLKSSEISDIEVETAEFKCPCGWATTKYQFEISNGNKNLTATSKERKYSFEKQNAGERYTARSRYICVWNDEQVHSSSEWSQWSDPKEIAPFYMDHLWLILLCTAGGIGAILILGFAINYLVKRRRRDRVAEYVVWTESNNRDSILFSAE